MIVTKKELEQKIEPAVPLLKQYWNLLLKWQKTVNLISSKTIEEGWNRHILDCAQIYFLLENQNHSLMDVGSGGGLPAIVIAILNTVLKGPLTSITLVESDLKKSLFLQECARELHLNITIIRERIENIQQSPDVITARAFAPLNELLTLVQKNVSRETILLLPKGKSVDDELKKSCWKYEVEKLKNVVNSEGCILKIKGVEHV